MLRNIILEVLDARGRVQHTRNETLSGEQIDCLRWCVQEINALAGYERQRLTELS